MNQSRVAPWLWVAPLAGWVVLAASLVVRHPLFALLDGAALIACVLAAVHHAEVVAHRVGEPFGTLLLALAVTVIEVALIVSLMLTGGAATVALARDTVFAAIMIILNGMVGVCLLLGATRHGEQSFGLYGVNATLAALAAISVITLVLPNATTTASGPSYSTSQLAFVAVVSLALYGVFVLVQTVSHRDYFLPQRGSVLAETEHAPRPSIGATAFSAVLLIVCLGAVILLAKAIAPVIEAGVDSSPGAQGRRWGHRCSDRAVAREPRRPDGRACQPASDQPQSRARLGDGLDRTDHPDRRRGFDRHGLDAGSGP